MHDGAHKGYGSIHSYAKHRRRKTLKESGKQNTFIEFTVRKILVDRIAVVVRRSDGVSSPGGRNGTVARLTITDKLVHRRRKQTHLR